MKFIPLSQKKFAIVDDIDYEWLSEYKWNARKKIKNNNNVTYYACSNIYMGKTGKQRFKKAINMHRTVINKMMEEQGINVSEYNFITDHINRNGIDNRRNNLRVCTNNQNQYNRWKSYFDKSPSSVYKGVCHKNKKWEAYMMIDDKANYIGRFSTEKLAAFVYDEYARKHHGEFALLNLPDLSEQDYKKLKKQWEDELNWKTSVFRGVVWDKCHQKWQASIRHKYHLYHLGFYDDEVIAAMAYDRQALEFRGDKAKLNFIDEMEI